MAGSPDLFVVCKNCRAEVSPYITECPYCGHRLRKRAPKLDKDAAPRREKPRRMPSPPSVPRPRSGGSSRARAAAVGRPVVTMALVGVSALMTILLVAGAFDFSPLVLPAADGEYWQIFTTSLLYPAFSFGSTCYELVTLGSVFLFGWLLERRHGHWAPLLVYVVSTVLGFGLVWAMDQSAFAMGANAGALGLLGAWVVRDLLALRRGEEVDADLLGVAAFAVVLLCMPAAVQEADPIAGAVGGVAGLLMGLGLARLRER